MPNCPVDGCSFSGPVEHQSFCSAHFPAHAPADLVASVLGAQEATRKARSQSLRRWEEALKSGDSATMTAMETEDPHFEPVWVDKAVARAVDEFDVAMATGIADAFPMYSDVIAREAQVGSTLGRNRQPIYARNGATHVLHALLARIQSHLRKACPGDAGVDALFDAMVARDDINEETLLMQTVEKAVYTTGGLRMVLALLPKCKITKGLVDSAAYLCKRPANVPTPERREILRHVEDAFKAQQRARREELKQQRLLEQQGQEQQPEQLGLATSAYRTTPPRTRRTHM
jgi:hypothetical protein